MAPVQRGWYDFFWDRVIAWQLGLPWESSSLTVEGVRIPVGDDVSLVGKVYVTSQAEPHGTILIRTPYGIGPGMQSIGPRFLAARGYNVLHAACRGTDPGDDCSFLPGVYEGPDGQATVRWMREQPWYTGSFAMLGASYVGYTQWAVLCDPPPDMKASVLNTGPTDLASYSFWTGALDAHLIMWADLMAATQGGNVGPDFLKAQAETLKPIFDGVPMVETMEKHFGADMPEWLRLSATDGNKEAPVLKKMNYSQALYRANIPILQQTGWDDALLDIVVHNHSILSGLGRPAHLTIGPWQHMPISLKATNLSFGFLEEHLAGKKVTKPRRQPIHLYVTGSNVWKDFDEWPPAPASTHVLYLDSENALSKSRPSKDDASSSFTFDPLEPTPDVGLPRPLDGAVPGESKSYEDTALAARSDVAVFTTEPLHSSLEIIGTPLVELHHSSDNPNVDLFVRLSEVKPNGKSTRISDRYQRLDPARGEGPLAVSLSVCAHRFAKGSKLRVIVAGGAHPAKIRNLGTGETPGTGTTTRPARHTVHHSASQLSKLSLPVAK